MKKIITPPATLSFRFPPQGGGLRGSFSAFTLVELMVSISLAIVLMTSISIFVTDGVKNITLQKNIVDNNLDFNDFKSIFSNTSNSLSNFYTGFTNSTGALFKANKNYYAGGFTYIGEQSFTGIYCSGTDNDSTNHLIIKNFVPFESVDGTGDIFSGNNYSSGFYKISFFSGTIKNNGNSFFGIYFGPTDIVFDSGTGMYVSDTLNHTVLKFDKNNTNKLPEIIVGKAGIFDENYASGQVGTGISLNNPTGLAYGDSNLFISDTLNDRILYLSGTNIYTLLDKYDSIKEPTGLAYDSASKILYISNSGSGEILSYNGGTDSNILTKQNNILKVITGSLFYPTGIKLSGGNLIFSDFLERKIKTIDSTNGTLISSSNLNPFDFSSLAYNKYSDYLLKTPIKSLDLNFSASKIFTFDMQYYKNYSCNDAKSNIERTYLFKKYIK